MGQVLAMQYWLELGAAWENHAALSIDNTPACSLIGLVFDWHMFQITRLLDNSSIDPFEVDALKDDLVRLAQCELRDNGL